MTKLTRREKYVRSKIEFKNILPEIQEFIVEVEQSLNFDFNDAVEKDKCAKYYYNSICCFIKKKFKETDLDLDELLIQIKKTKLKIDDFILDGLNTIYNTSFCIDDIYSIYESIIYKEEFEFVFKKIYVNNVERPNFISAFNTNPKNDYPQARRIKRHFIIHYGSTNTGKTYDALQKLKSCDKGIYLGPLRLLALEVYETLNKENIICNLITGEEEIQLSNAKLTSSTVEKLDLSIFYEIAIIDEAQLIADKNRGWAWTRAILGIQSKEVHICCSSNALDLIISIIKDIEDSFEIIEYKRNIPLVVEREKFIFPQDVKSGDALIVFSRAKALQVAAALNESKIKSSIIYGNLPPETRKQQFNLFLNQKTDVVVTTDAIGMGVNLPIRRIVFLETKKYDGFEFRELESQELKQIAGRAGRKGIYDKGYVNSIENKKHLRELLKQEDCPLEYAYLFPTEETLFEFKNIKLNKKLQLWRNQTHHLELYRTSDVSDISTLLTSLEVAEINLDEKIIYKMVTIPFNANNSNLKFSWLKYCQNIVNNTNLQYPICEGEDLKSLETYYSTLSIYYSFAKTFDISYINTNLILDEKYKTANLINENLVRNIKTHQKKCKKCAKILPWNYIYNFCEMCYFNEFIL